MENHKRTRFFFTQAAKIIRLNCLSNASFQFVVGGSKEKLCEEKSCFCKWKELDGSGKPYQVSWEVMRS